MTDKPDNTRPGVIVSIKRLLRNSVAIVHNRIELFAVELQEERARFLGVLLLAAIIAVLALLTLVMLTFTILLAVGEGNRFLAAVIITAVYFVATVAGVLALRARLKNWSMFSATRDELRKDREWLESKDSRS